MRPENARFHHLLHDEEIDLKRRPLRFIELEPDAARSRDLVDLGEVVRDTRGAMGDDDPGEVADAEAGLSRMDVRDLRKPGL